MDGWLKARGRKLVAVALLAVGVGQLAESYYTWYPAGLGLAAALLLAGALVWRREL